MDTIPLREAIRALRGEILEARDEAIDENLHFELGPIEMEFHVIAKREAGADAKLGFHILTVEASLGGNGKISSERAQKVKFVLNPVIDTPEGPSKVSISRGGPSEVDSSVKLTLERS